MELFNLMAFIIMLSIAGSICWICAEYIEERLTA